MQVLVYLSYNIYIIIIRILQKKTWRPTEV